jgi:hypothetical protein
VLPGFVLNLQRIFVWVWRYQSDDFLSFSKHSAANTQ